MSNTEISVDNTSVIRLILAIFTAFVGYEIHGSFFWAIINFIFWWLSWIKWLIYQDVSVSVIRKAFDFFLT